MKVLKAILLATFFVSASAYAGTPFQQVEKLFDHAVKPDLTADLNKDAVWAGKCVSKLSQTTLGGGALNIYFTGDAVLGSSTRIIPLFGTSENQYVDMSAAQANQLWGSYRNQQHLYSALQDNNDPILSDLVSSYRKVDAFGRVVEGVDFKIRKATTDTGAPYFMVAFICPFSSCSGQFHYGETGHYCYYYQNKTSAEESADVGLEGLEE